MQNSILIKKSFLFTALLSASLFLSGITGAKGQQASVSTHQDATGGVIVHVPQGNFLKILLDSSLDIYGAYAEDSFTAPLDITDAALDNQTDWTVTYLQHSDIKHDTNIPSNSQDPFVPAFSILMPCTPLETEYIVSAPSPNLALSSSNRKNKFSILQFYCGQAGRTMIKVDRAASFSTFYHETLTFIIQIDPPSSTNPASSSETTLPSNND